MRNERHHATSRFELTQDDLRVIGDFKHTERIEITRLNIVPPNADEQAVYTFEREHQPLEAAIA